MKIENIIICETTPRPMETITRVEATVIDGIMTDITAWLPQKQIGSLRFDFYASPDSWREIIQALAPHLGLVVTEEKTCAVLQDDIHAILEVIRQAHKDGRGFNRTGRNGLYIRRTELPGRFQRMGRDRLEQLAADLMRSGMIAQDIEGKLTVTDIPDNP